MIMKPTGQGGRAADGLVPECEHVALESSEASTGSSSVHERLSLFHSRHTHSSSLPITHATVPR
jgi:hypothetical protein